MASTAETPQRPVGDLPDRLRPTTGWLTVDVDQAELGRNDHVAAVRRKGLADQLLVRQRSVHLSSVEERHTELDGTTDDLDHLVTEVAFCHPAAETHAAEAERRHLEPAASERSSVHDQAPTVSRVLIARRSSMARYPSATSWRERQVEDLAGVDFAPRDEIEQVGKEPSDRGRPAVQVDVREEQFVAEQLDVVADTDVADVSTGAGGADGLHHRLLCTDRFDRRVRTETVGELLDTCDAVVAARFDNVGGAVVGGELLAWLVALGRGPWQS
jgi:hypothetical protein